MKLTFEHIKKNIETLKIVKSLYTQIDDYRNNKIEWGNIVYMDLCSYSHFDYTLCRSDIDYLIGNKTIDFESLKKIMITEANDLLIIMKNENGEEKEEINEFIQSIKFIENLTPKIIEKCLSNYEHFTKMIPSLYRIEKSIMPNIWYKLINYSI